jgi:hypothetical protein
VGCARCQGTVVSVLEYSYCYHARVLTFYVMAGMGGLQGSAFFDKCPGANNDVLKSIHQRGKNPWVKE